MNRWMNYGMVYDFIYLFSGKFFGYYKKLRVIIGAVQYSANYRQSFKSGS